MANVNPLLKTIIDIRHRLEAGESLRKAIPTVLSTETSDWSQTLKKWLIAHEHGRPTDSIIRELKSPYRRVFLETLASGLMGAPIYQNILELESEVRSACELEVDAHLKKLPFLAMLPVLLLMFPAFLILLLGPIFNHLLQELSK